MFSSKHQLAYVKFVLVKKTKKSIYLCEMICDDTIVFVMTMVRKFKILICSSWFIQEGF